MSGISSKAAGIQENKKQKFQGQEFASKEFSDGSGLDMYEFKWRMHDPQIGRFWQVDPLSEKYVYNSTYAFSENKVTGHVELEGLESASVNDIKDRRLRALARENVQKAATEVKNNASTSFELQAGVGVGVGLKGKVGGVGIEAGINGPQATVNMNSGGDIKAEGSMAEGGVVLTKGKGNVGGKVSLGKVEVSDGKTSFENVNTSAVVDVNSSREVGAGQGGQIESSFVNTSITAGGKIGIVSVEVTANIVNAGKAVIGFFGVLVEYTKEVIRENLPSQLGGSFSPPKK